MHYVAKFHEGYVGTVMSAVIIHCGITTSAILLFYFEY